MQVLQEATAERHAGELQRGQHLHTRLGRAGHLAGSELADTLGDADHYDLAGRYFRLPAAGHRPRSPVAGLRALGERRDRHRKTPGGARDARGVWRASACWGRLRRAALLQLRPSHVLVAHGVRPAYSQDNARGPTAIHGGGASGGGTASLGRGLRQRLPRAGERRRRRHLRYRAAGRQHAPRRHAPVVLRLYIRAEQSVVAASDAQGLQRDHTRVEGAGEELLDLRLQGLASCSRPDLPRGPLRQFPGGAQALHGGPRGRILRHVAR
mmetsp:Transcript_73276/g.212242  ORF Transcript_73276/g.212242 Transcript_73276/m.212242 type:complete len:268 (+) Transcript_73276:1357-2160(+)